MVKILFVCQGNICRSPAAEGVFNRIVSDAGVAHGFETDSAGTIGFHAGEPADARMQKHAAKRGYKLTSISRKVKVPDDFNRFDMLIAMDNENFNDLKRVAPTPDHAAKVYKMVQFATRGKYAGVPDPYYGGDAGFELVLDILEDACNGLLDSIVRKK